MGFWASVRCWWRRRSTRASLGVRNNCCQRNRRTEAGRSRTERRTFQAADCQASTLTSRLVFNKNTDLVEIAPQNSPPVCKLADFSKFRYEREKKLKEARKKHKGGQVKELRIRPKIGFNDLNIKIGHMREFIQEHDKVRLTIVFRGREMEHPEQAKPLVQRVKEGIADVAVLEQDIPMEGNRKSLLFAPKK